MNNIKSSLIELDEEFENLIKPFSELECHRIQLGAVLRNNTRIRVWQNIVICDSYLYKTCTESDIPFDIVHEDFPNRNAALTFVCTEQLQREDLTYEYKKYLIGKLFNLEKRTLHSKRITKLSIASDLGTTYSVSAGAIQKYGLYAEAIDHLFDVAPELARTVLDDRLRISHESTIELARFPKDELSIIAQITKDSRSKRMTFSEIKHEIRWKNYTATNKASSKPRKEENVEIKKMPAYDPDADIMGIALTIPSWIKAINRAVEHTDIAATTPKGRNSFKEQLYALDDVVIKVISLMEV